LDGILRVRNLSYRRGLSGLDLEIIIGFARRGKIRVGRFMAKFLISIGPKNLYV